MGDVFLEQLVKKKNSSVDLLKKVGIMVAGLVIAFAAMLFGFGSQFFGSIALLLAVGAIYFAWYFMTSLNLEFEYIYTNGEIDVDRIAAKRKRKRMTTVKISGFEEFDKFNAERYKNQQYDVKLDASVSWNEPNTYYAVYHNRENKKCILIFNPDERLLPEIEKIYRRRVRIPQ